MVDKINEFYATQVYVSTSAFEFLHNSKFSTNSWQDSASIDIQWSQPIECQCWQDPAKNWQELTNYAKTRLNDQ